MDPTIVDRETVFIVDGDRARIKAIREELPKARVLMCVWHKAENFEENLGSAVRAEVRREAATDDVDKMTMDDIKQELADKKVAYCKSWRKPKLADLLRSSRATSAAVTS